MASVKDFFVGQVEVRTAGLGVEILTRDRPFTGLSITDRMLHYSLGM